MNNRDVLILLNLVEGLGPKTIHKIRKSYGQYENVLGESSLQLKNKFSLSDKVAEHMLETTKSDSYQKELDLIQKRDISILTIDDENYPARLSEISDPPPVLYLKGCLNFKMPFIAVVGARRASVYGKDIAFKLAYELSAHGIGIVSGFARGIDTQAHLGALQAKSQTIAVLGNGLDKIYPPENERYIDPILATGGFVSEFPLKMPPLAGHFPRRNRIISGLSLGVLVIEASRKSGSLITADFALEEGRDVFAVPGPIQSPNSHGVHALIKQGACLVESVNDILEALSFEQKDLLKEQLNLSSKEVQILSVLDGAPKGIDQICMASKQSTSSVLSTLFSLELKKQVKQYPGKFYVKSEDLQFVSRSVRRS